MKPADDFDVLIYISNKARPYNAVEESIAEFIKLRIENPNEDKYKMADEALSRWCIKERE